MNAASGLWTWPAPNRRNAPNMLHDCGLRFNLAGTDIPQGRATDAWAHDAEPKQEDPDLRGIAGRATKLSRLRRRIAVRTGNRRPRERQKAALR